MNDDKDGRPEQRLVHTELMPIRWGDMDAMRHVNNTVYFRYMEQARISWIDGMRAALAAEGLGTVIASTSCTYRKPLTYPGTVEVKLFAGRIGGSSVKTHYELRMEGEAPLFASGEAVVVWVSMQTGKAVRVPRAIRDSLGAPEQ
jgi:acyl-CoA thioester hydrolase